MASRAQIVAAARAYLNTPYKHQGRSLVGVDCAGLLVRVARDLGTPMSDIIGYGQTPDSCTLVAHVAGQSEPIPRDQTRPGDVLLMRFRRAPQHLAIATEQGIIHSYAGAGRVVEHALDRNWEKRIVAVYKFPGVDE